jgi:hypothetical protein
MKKPLIHDDPIVAVLATWLVGQVEIATGIVFNDEEDEENEKTQTETGAASYEGGAGMVVPVHVSTALVSV